MHNIPTVNNNRGITLAWSVDWVIDTLHNCGLTKAESIRPAYEMDGEFLGYAVIVFGGDEESFTQALKLERSFFKRDASRFWFVNDDERVGPYVWLAKCHHVHDDTHLLTACHGLFQSTLKTVPKPWEEKNVD